MAPLWVLLSASCFSPQLTFADFENECINLEHFVAVQIKCSIKLSLLSMIMPRYLMVLSCSVCVYVCTF
jgi:hypothetical protein